MSAAPNVAAPAAGWQDSADRPGAISATGDRADAGLARPEPSTIAALAAVTTITLLSGVVLLFGSAGEGYKAYTVPPPLDARARQVDTIVVAKATVGDTPMVDAAAGP